MRIELYKKIEIPENVEVKIEGGLIKLSGPAGKNEREFRIKNLEFKKNENSILIGGKKITKKEKKIINTTAAHIRNLIKGVQEKFEYRLKVCFSHFPITVELKGNEAIIKNFLGEKVARKCVVLPNSEVNVAKDVITVKSNDLETAGQTAANLEIATRIRKRDRRVFQDGIFMTHKPGVEI